MRAAGPLKSEAAFVRHTYLVIDFEGLTPKGRSPVPIEVAVCALRASPAGLVELWRFTSLIAPPADVPVTRFDVRQTGITTAMLATAASPEQVMADLHARLTAPPYRLVAHHAPTEAGLIAAQPPTLPDLGRHPAAGHRTTSLGDPLLAGCYTRRGRP